MSDHLRFDPYTGDPIPEEPETNTQDSFTPSTQDTYTANLPDDVVTPNQENEISMQEPSQAPIPDSTSAVPTNTPATDSMYIPQSTPSAQAGYYNNQAPQYNPYTGQTMNQPPNNTNEINSKATKLGTASLIVGICSIVFSFCTMCCCPFLSIPLGIAGIICGVKAKDASGERLGTGTAGLITSIIGLVITVFFLIIVMIYMSTDDFKRDFQKGFEQGMRQYQTENGTNSFGNDKGYNNYNNDIYDNDGFYSN